MLNILYADNKISSANSSLYVIESDKDDIEISGIIPVYAYVTARIIADNHTFVIPLSFKNAVDNTSIFKGKLFLTDYDINCLSKAESIYLKIYIDQVVIPGEIVISFNSRSIARLKTRNESVIIPLAKEVAALKARLDSYMNKNFPYDSTNKVVKGMVPVAVDSLGNYIWDFPFNATEQLIIELSKNVVSQAELIKSLTARVATLENQISDHITESYYI